jgi:hypothetical protein
MAISTRTTSTVSSRTNLTSNAPRKDGGREWIGEAFDLIHTAKQIGQLTVNFGTGGSISSMHFDETSSVVHQEDLKFADEA